MRFSFIRPSKRDTIFGSPEEIGRKVRDFYRRPRPEERCVFVERINSQSKSLFCVPLFWHRDLHCRPICPFGLRGNVLHPAQPVRDLRFFSWFEFLCDNLDYDSRVGRYAVLSPASNPLDRGRSSTCDMGSRKSFRGKTSHRFSDHLRFCLRRPLWVILRVRFPTLPRLLRLAARRIGIGCRLGTLSISPLHGALPRG